MLTNHLDGLLGLVRTQAANGAFELYLSWRQESSTCEAAYRDWLTRSPSSDRALAFIAYAAALDREQQAATEYAAACGGWTSNTQ
jgi:hypothetical protein